MISWCVFSFLGSLFSILQLLYTLQFIVKHSKVFLSLPVKTQQLIAFAESKNHWKCLRQWEKRNQLITYGTKVKEEKLLSTEWSNMLIRNIKTQKQPRRVVEEQWSMMNPNDCHSYYQALQSRRAREKCRKNVKETSQRMSGEKRNIERI